MIISGLLLQEKCDVEILYDYGCVTTLFLRLQDRCCDLYTSTCCLCAVTRTLWSVKFPNSGDDIVLLYVGLLHYIITNHWTMERNSNVEHWHVMKKRDIEQIHRLWIVYKIENVQQKCAMWTLVTDKLHQKHLGGTSKATQQ